MLERVPSIYRTYEELKSATLDTNWSGSAAHLPYLWGIEIIITHILHLLYYLAFTVPMRNWNYIFSVKSFRPQFKAFTVPMRNWNTEGQLNLMTVYIGIYRTYEELKLRWWEMPVTKTTSIYRTYEELKSIYLTLFI